MTPKLKNHIESPKFICDETSDFVLKADIDITHEPFDCDLSIRFLGSIDESQDPPVIKKLFYMTNLQDEDLGLIDAITELAQGKNIEELKKIQMVDLDHFLRETPHVPSFKFYHTDYYKLLAGLELISDYVKKKKHLKPWHNKERDGSFLSLPTFEKIDLVDEILERFLVIPGAVSSELFCDDIKGNEIFILSSKELDTYEEDQILKALRYHLHEENLRLNLMAR